MPARIPAHVREQQINNLPNITFVRWDGEYRNNLSKAVCRCDIDGFEWYASVSNLLNHGHGCPQCSGVRRWTASERVDQINSLPDITFVRWDGEYRNAKSKAVCRCDVDGFEWSANADNLVNNDRSCPLCGFKSRCDKRRTPSDVRVKQINDAPNTMFVGWVGGVYSNTNSKAVCRCDVGHEWSASVDSLTHMNSGCPQCAEYGYNPTKPGTLYALRSECGTMVKIGISNNYERRRRELVRATPFSWSCVELIHGDGALIASLEKAFHGMTEPVSFNEPFDGYTEWRRWTPELAGWFDTWKSLIPKENENV